jgi:hypothetical protein
MQLGEKKILAQLEPLAVTAGPMQQRVREWCSLCTARVRETKQWSPPNLEDYEFVAILGHGTTSGDDVTVSDD